MRSIEDEIAGLDDSTRGKLAALLDRSIYPTTTTFDRNRSADAFYRLSRGLLPSQVWKFPEIERHWFDESAAPEKNDKPPPKYGTPEYEEWRDEQHRDFEETLKRADNIIFSFYKMHLNNLGPDMMQFSPQQQAELRAMMESIILADDDDDEETESAEAAA